VILFLKPSLHHLNMYQSAPSPVPIIKREEQAGQENQTTRKRDLAELNADDLEEGEIFDELDNYLNNERFSSLHLERKKQRLTSTTDLRVDSLPLRAAKSQTTSWRDIDLEDEMSWICEQEAVSCSTETSYAAAAPPISTAENKPGNAFFFGEEQGF
jgi:hypothetical protein